MNVGSKASARIMSWEGARGCHIGGRTVWGCQTAGADVEVSGRRDRSTVHDPPPTEFLPSEISS